MLSNTSGTPTLRVSQEMLAAGLKFVPKLDVEAANAAVEGRQNLDLKSKQVNLVVAHVNQRLRSLGLKPIDPKELLGPGLKSTQAGCLDPCEGVATDRILSLIEQHFGGGAG